MVLRFYIVQNLKNIKKFTLKICYYIVLFCTVNGLFWALMPVLGWSYYSLEASYTSCSVEWKDKSFNVVSFNVSLFGFLYLIPVMVILTTSLKLILKLKTVSQNILNQTKNEAILKKRIIKEKKLTKIIFLIICK